MGARWCAAGTAAASLVGNGAPAARAEVREIRTGAEFDGNGGSDGFEDDRNDRFGSKAYTKKSYDGFADGYDELDGGWAASALGTEVSGSTAMLPSKPHGVVFQFF